MLNFKTSRPVPAIDRTRLQPLSRIEFGSHKPSWRHSLTRRQTENRFEKQNKALMRRGSPYFEYAVTVVDLTYNEDRKGWDYQVKDDGTGILWTSWVAERDLKRA